MLKNLRKQFLDIHIRNVMPKIESSRLNGVARIEKKHNHTAKHINDTVIPKTIFAVIDNAGHGYCRIAYSLVCVCVVCVLVCQMCIYRYKIISRLCRILNLIPRTILTHTSKLRCYKVRNVQYKSQHNLFLFLQSYKTKKNCFVILDMSRYHNLTRYNFCLAFLVF